MLLSGSWNLNPWFVQVEQIPMTEIPIGYVGVVVSYVGKEHVDLSGDDFTHGDLVEKGRKGVWIEPLLPGKHPINTRVMKVELVPTTNIVLNWATAREAHKYDEKLSSITVRSQGRLQLHARRVADHPHRHEEGAAGHLAGGLDAEPGRPRAAADGGQLLPQLGAAGARCSSSSRRAASARRRRSRRSGRAVEAYDVECIDTLIGDIVPPAELMKTQTDRKIADELQRTYEVQREAQVKRQQLERETAIANMQAEVVRSEQMVAISAKNALAVAETAKGEAARVRLEAEAEAHAIRIKGEAEAGAKARGRGEGARPTEAGVAAHGGRGVHRRCSWRGIWASTT